MVGVVAGGCGFRLRFFMVCSAFSALAFNSAMAASVAADGPRTLLLRRVPTTGKLAFIFSNEAVTEAALLDEDFLESFDDMLRVECHKDVDGDLDNVPLVGLVEGFAGGLA